MDMYIPFILGAIGGAICVFVPYMLTYSIIKKGGLLFKNLLCLLFLLIWSLQKQLHFGFRETDMLFFSMIIIPAYTFVGYFFYNCCYFILLCLQQNKRRKRTLKIHLSAFVDVFVASSFGLAFALALSKTTLEHCIAALFVLLMSSEAGGIAGAVVSAVMLTTVQQRKRELKRDTFSS